MSMVETEMEKVVDITIGSTDFTAQKCQTLCVHCSAGCSLEYTIDAIDLSKNITNSQDKFLCPAAYYEFDFQKRVLKDKVSFDAAVLAIKNAYAVRFTSVITNEEAHILQLLKKRLGVKLFNEDARNYALFMKAYSSVSGKRHHSAALAAIESSDAVVLLGTRVVSDNPALHNALVKTSSKNSAKILYAHPIEDASMQTTLTQFIKYEAGAEEGVVALLANELLQNAALNEEEKAFFDGLDIGYLEAESNLGDDELTKMSESLSETKQRVLVLGSDLLSHPRASNIAKIAALIEKYTDFSILVVPSEINTVGVSLLCELDEDERTKNIVGYNAEGDFVLSSLEGADLSMPTLNQQHGTIVNIDNSVLPLDTAVVFEGYRLNDVANALGVCKESTSDYTQELDSSSGFKAISYDALQGSSYILNEQFCEMDGILEEVADLPEFNGTVIYQSNSLEQRLQKDLSLYGSAQFAVAARIADGERVKITVGSQMVTRVFKLDNKLKGTIALNPTFDAALDARGYKFKKSKIERVVL